MLRRYYSSKVVPLTQALNIKVGQIASCQLHPQADRLYVSQISIGGDESDQIQVVSGLVDFVSKSTMIDKRVVVLTNMKRAKIRGVQSDAMLLATHDENLTKVELINPPSDSKVGDRLCFGEFENSSANKAVSSKLWQEIKLGLFVNSEGIAVFRQNGVEYKLQGENSDFARSDTLKDTHMS